MTQKTWDAVDAYFGDLLLGTDPVLDAVRVAARDGGLPDIAVAPTHGAFLSILARAVGAKRILEVGTLGGYSTIWLARGLAKGGKVITLEVSAKHAEVARANFARAHLADRIEVRVGKGADLLPQLAEEKAGPFDLCFIDADKANNATYFEWALKLSRKGSLIVVDNMVRGGAVAKSGDGDGTVTGVRTLAELLANETRVKATVIQTVGVKGYDGFAIAAVL